MAILKFREQASVAEVQLRPGLGNQRSQGAGTYLLGIEQVAVENGQRGSWFIYDLKSVNFPWQAVGLPESMNCQWATSQAQYFLMFKISPVSRFFFDFIECVFHVTTTISKSYQKRRERTQKVEQAWYFE